MPQAIQGRAMTARGDAVLAISAAMRAEFTGGPPPNYRATVAFVLDFLAEHPEFWPTGEAFVSVPLPRMPR